VAGVLVGGTPRLTVLLRGGLLVGGLTVLVGLAVIEGRVAALLSRLTSSQR